MRVFVTGTRGIPEVMGGVETHCQELMPRLAALGADITVARRDSYVAATAGMGQWQGVKLCDLHTPRRKSLEAITHTLRAVIRARRSKAQLLHIHAIGPALLTPLARLLGLRVVFTHHGFDYDRQKWGPVAKAALRLGERLGCRYATEVIVISNDIRRHIERKYGRADHLHLIYNGVPEPRLCDYPEYFGSLGIEPGRYILAACRFVPEKNLHHLLEAFQSLHLEGYKLVLAGDTDFEDAYSRQLKQRARQAGAVLPGFVRGRELHSLLTHAACYCLPSSHEGLPIALLEAMSYGLPVVVSDIPANREIGLPQSCYFPCGDVAAMAQRLQLTLSSKHAPTYDMTPYNWDAIASKTMEVYRQALT